MWDENRHFSTYIRAAIDAKLPPKAVIFDDASHVQWDVWDFKLLKAYHFAQDMMSGNFPVWIDESDRVTFDVKSKVSKSRRAIEVKTSGKNFKAQPGQYFVATPRTVDGGALPTFEEWVEEQRVKNPGSENRVRG